MMTLKVKSNIRNYEVVFTRDFQFLSDLSRIQPRAVVIDRNVLHYYEDLISEHFKVQEVFIFDAKEENKSLETLGQMYNWLVQKEAKRNLTLVSIGGGITQDVTGFVASTLYRGIPWVFVPTTLLAQTDSCIGSKTSINYHRYKNLLGTFYPPLRIYVNTDFRSTLTDQDYYSGVGEIIKLQLMKDHDRLSPRQLVALMERCRHDNDILDGVVRENLATKIAYMENDEFDLGRRNLLNYGHCFGHAIETSSAYYVPHGIAVNIGIIFANALSMKRGFLKEKLFMEVTESLNIPNIPLKLQEEHFDHDMLLESMKNDKKRTGENLTVIIPDGEFRPHKINDVRDVEFSWTLEYVKKLLFGEKVLDMKFHEDVLPSTLS